MPSRILVIEDNKVSIEMLDYLLQSYGYVALLATSGEEGVRIAARIQPDLILLDIRMPGMNGYEVAATIRQQPALQKARIVAVTASVTADDRERIAAAGFDGLIEKPIDPQTFVGEIERFMDAKPTRVRAIELTGAGARGCGGSSG